MTALANLKRFAEAARKSWQMDGNLVSVTREQADLAMQAPEILAAIAEFEQREQKVERLIAAGEEASMCLVAGEILAEGFDRPKTAAKIAAAERELREAVADLQADSPPPIARDPIPDTGGKIKW